MTISTGHKILRAVSLQWAEFTEMAFMTPSVESRVARVRMTTAMTKQTCADSKSDALSHMWGM
jgi:hypothetical protein